MGWFVNPRDETKEAWLARNGSPATRDEVMALDLSGLDEPDGRPVSFWLVDRSKLESEFAP